MSEEMTGSPDAQKDFAVRTDPQAVPPSERWKVYSFEDVSETIKEEVRHFFESAMENGPDNNLGVFNFKDSRRLGEVLERIDFEKVNIDNNPAALDRLRLIRYNLMRVTSWDGDDQFPKYENRVEAEAGMAEVVEASQMFLKPQEA
jgi:hypothetical protein